MTKPIQKLAQFNFDQTALLVEKRMSDAEIPANDPEKGKALGQMKSEWKRFTGRHLNGGYICFVDAHVEWFSTVDMETASNFAAPGDHNNPTKVIWDPFGPEF